MTRRCPSGDRGQLILTRVTLDRRRAAAAGIATKVSCHSFRATGITVYPWNGGKPEVAQQIARHESAYTTGLCDRRHDAVALDEVTYENSAGALRR
jgi:hypothetical protein